MPNEIEISIEMFFKKIKILNDMKTNYSDKTKSVYLECVEFLKKQLKKLEELI